MKLTSTLKLRPDFLYLAPLLNVIMLMLIFFLVNSSLVVQGGTGVELASTTSTLPRLERAHVLAVPAGEEMGLFFNKEKIGLTDLPSLLQKGKGISLDVIIAADSLVSTGRIAEIREIIWAAGCRPAEAGKLGSN